MIKPIDREKIAFLIEEKEPIYYKEEPEVQEVEATKAPAKIKKPSSTQIKKTVASGGSYGAVSLDTANEDQVKNRIAFLNTIAKIMENGLIAGVDYGIIPGTPKPCLLKSGAEKVLLLFGLSAEYEIVESSRTTQEVFYMIKCNLKHLESGNVIAQSFGTCSNKEKGKEAQPTNTILKIAQKRAMVGAAISVGNMSQVFTQDLDDEATRDALKIQAPQATNGGNSYRYNNYLSKNEVLNLYGVLYNALINDYEKLSWQGKAEKKEIFKAQILPGILNELQINASNLYNINKEEKNKIEDYINTPEAIEKWTI